MCGKAPAETQLVRKSKAITTAIASRKCLKILHTHDMASQDNENPASGAHEHVNTTSQSSSATGDSPQDAPQPADAEPVQAPASDENEDEAPLHLEFRAPTFQHREEKISKWGMRLPGFSAEWQTRRETQCIRCKTLAVSRTIAVSIPGIVGIGATADYSESFPRVHADLEVGRQNILGHQHSRVDHSAADDEDGILSSEQVRVTPMGFQHEKSLTAPGGVEAMPNSIPPYVVLGIFPRPDGIPRERMVRIKDPAWLFWYIFLAIVRLHGISYFLSLKDVKGFSIYKCNWKTGVHKRVCLEQRGINDLRLLLLSYNSWWNSDRIGEGWTNWIHKTINNSSTNPRENTDGNSLSIEVVMGWSPFRISVVILLPTLLSFVIGIWFNSRDWNDLTTIQTAWGIASYVATAGGLIAALLGFISGIKDE